MFGYKEMKRELIATCALLLAGCGVSDHEATTTVGTTTVVAHLQPAHRFLAEYRKTVEIHRQGSTSYRKELFFDSGGYPWIALFQSDNDLIIQDIGPESIVVDLRTGETRTIPTPKRQPESYVGRFDFDISQKRLFRFIESSEQPFDSARKLSGG